MSKDKKGAGGVAVREPEMVPLSKLRPAPYNPRVMPEAMMRSLMASLRESGLVLNLVVQRRSAEHGPMVIVGGHQRVEALRRVCAEDGRPLPERVPAVVLDLDDRAAKRLNVALNRVEGEFVDDLLGRVLATVGQPDAAQLAAMGFSGDEFAALLRAAEPIDVNVAADVLEAEAAALLQSAGAAGCSLIVEFDDAASRDAARDALRASAKERNVRPGRVLLEALRKANIGGPAQGNGHAKGDDRGTGAGKAR